jgi:hypothetical protein
MDYFMEDLSHYLHPSLVKSSSTGGQVEILTLDCYPSCLISFLATLHPYILLGKRGGGEKMVLVRKCKNAGAGVCIQGTTIWTVS